MINYNISKNEIAIILDLNICDNGEEYIGVSTIDAPKDQSVLFIRTIKDEHLCILKKFSNCLIITQEINNFDFDTITVDNTRLAMAKILNYISSKNNLNNPEVSNTAYVHPKAQIVNNVEIGSFSYIDENVIIGDNVKIKQGVKVLKYTSIGNNSIIRENTVVGGQGFGVEKDENRNNLKIAHLGGVIIGNNVEIGALNTIVSGTINPTVIEDYVKVDDHVHIAHNCKIGQNSIITAGVIFSGSVTIGSNVWVGPNSTIKNSLSIAKDNLIGIGTVITKDIIDENKTYAGVPGSEFINFMKNKKAMDYLVKNIDKLKKILEENEYNKGEN